MPEWQSLTFDLAVSDLTQRRGDAERTEKGFDHLVFADLNSSRLCVSALSLLATCNARGYFVCDFQLDAAVATNILNHAFSPLILRAVKPTTSGGIECLCARCLLGRSWRPFWRR